MIQQLELRRGEIKKTLNFNTFTQDALYRKVLISKISQQNLLLLLSKPVGAILTWILNIQSLAVHRLWLFIPPTTGRR